MKNRPQPSEYPSYYDPYIKSVEGNDIIKALTNQVIGIPAMISQIPEDKEDFAYAPGKWTIKEVLGHVIDTERIFGYRALRFARKDKTPLSGFDENIFVANANFNKRTLYDLAHEFAIVRNANIVLFKHFDSPVYNEMGNANGKEVSVRAILYMTAGHASHHMNVIQTKYLVD
jgi:hypothetical protein